MAEPAPELRRRVGARVGELEAAITDRRTRLDALAEQAATEAPTLADVAPLLAALPVLADGLHSAPQAELRALFEQLNLEVSYQPGEQALDVAITLYDDRTDQSPQPDLRRTNPVPPAGAGPVLRRIVRLKRRLKLP